MRSVTWPELSRDDEAITRLADRYPIGLRVRCQATGVHGTVTRSGVGYLHGDTDPAAHWSDGCGHCVIAVHWDDDPAHGGVAWTAPSDVERVVGVGFAGLVGVAR